MARAWTLASCSWTGNDGRRARASPSAAARTVRRAERAGGSVRRGASAETGIAAIAGAESRRRPGSAAGGRGIGGCRSAGARRAGDAGRHRPVHPSRRNRPATIEPARRRAWADVLADAPRRRLDCEPSRASPGTARRRPRRGRVPGRRARRGENQDHAGGAEVGLEKDRDRAPDVAAAADRRAGLKRGRELVDEAGGHDEHEHETERGPEPVGDGPAARSEGG